MMAFPDSDIVSGETRTKTGLNPRNIRTTGIAWTRGEGGVKHHLVKQGTGHSRTQPTAIIRLNKRINI